MFCSPDCAWRRGTPTVAGTLSSGDAPRWRKVPTWASGNRTSPFVRWEWHHCCVYCKKKNRAVEYHPISCTGSGWVSADSISLFLSGLTCMLLSLNSFVTYSWKLCLLLLSCCLHMCNRCLESGVFLAIPTSFLLVILVQVEVKAQLVQNPEKYKTFLLIFTHLFLHSFWGQHDIIFCFLRNQWNIHPVVNVCHAAEEPNHQRCLWTLVTMATVQQRWPSGRRDLLFVPLQVLWQPCPSMWRKKLWRSHYWSFKLLKVGNENSSYLIQS